MSPSKIPGWDQFALTDDSYYDGCVEKGSKRLVIVSNRLPVICRKSKQGRWEVRPSAGGLITALDPVFKNRGGIWVGWPGTIDATLEELKEPLFAADGLGYRFVPVSLTREERDNFYLGFSNEVIWPLFHDLQTRCHFEPVFFRTYEAVNKKFASVVAQQVESHDLIWVQDYHLMALAKELRHIGVTSKIAFFLHIPFPPLDIFLKLPWRSEILNGLLQFDVLGFQTVRDVRNFMQCVRMLFPKKGLERGRSTQPNVHHLQFLGREISVGSFPIGIDYQSFAQGAANPNVAEKTLSLREDLPDRQIVLGIDRLDYTKGIPYKLRAFQTALENSPELKGKMTLVQNVVPSRENIAEYHDLKVHIEQLVGEINGKFSRPGWIPIHYMFHTFDRPTLLAYYRMADIAMVTPLKDGMNLVAKEYCAANVDEEGVLILSEFAGAAAELQKGCLLVNPYDIEGMAAAIHRAFKMDQKEKRQKMQKLRRQIKTHNIFKWADSYLRVAISKDLSAFPEPQDYMPSMNIA